MESPVDAKIIPDAWYEQMFAAGSSGIAARISALGVSSKSNSSTHALSIIGRVAKDPAFSHKAIGFGQAQLRALPTALILEKCLDKLLPLFEEWTVGTSQEELDQKVEELFWMNTVIYAAAGIGGRKYSKDPKKEFNGDFLL